MTNYGWLYFCSSILLPQMEREEKNGSLGQSCIADQSCAWCPRSVHELKKSSRSSSCPYLNLSFDLKITSDHWEHWAQWADVSLRSKLKFRYWHELERDRLSQIIAVNLSWSELYELYTTLAGAQMGSSSLCYISQIDLICYQEGKCVKMDK